MKKTVIALAIATGVVAAPAFAEEAASPLSFNVGVVSDYVFRGISQTHGKPALQGGVDYAHSSGLYVGAWGSNIQWVSDAQDRSVPLEIDIYGGYKNTFGGGDWNYDIGYIFYNYPGTKYTPANASANTNTQEAYAAIGWKFLTLKYSYATSKHFIGWYGGSAGTDTTKNTRGSDYLELNANYDLGDGWNLIGHVGHQKVKNYQANGKTNASYTDWKLGVTKDIGFGVLGLAYTDTDARGNCPNTYGAWTAGQTNAYCWYKFDKNNSNNSTGFRDMSKAQIILSFTKTF